MAYAIPYRRNALGKIWDKVVLYFTVKMFGIAIALTLGKRGQRMSHNNGIAARGIFTFDPDPGIPTHTFIERGKTLPCRIRHAMATFFDDAMPTIRSCSLKLSDEYYDSPFDLQCNTGSVGLFWNIASFIKLATLRRETYGIEYEEYYREYPDGRAGAIAVLRDRPATFAHQTYYNKTPQLFDSSDGKRYYAKYRITPYDPLTVEEEKALGIVKGSGTNREMEPQNQRVAPGETLTRNYLKEEYEHRVRHHGPVKYRLEIQTRPHIDSQDPIIFNCCRDWPEDEFPWRNLGHFSITETLNWEDSVLTSFSVSNAPKGMGPIPATSIYDYNSLNYMRAHADFAYKMRLFYYRVKGMIPEPPDNDVRNSSEPV